MLKLKQQSDCSFFKIKPARFEDPNSLKIVEICTSSQQKLESQLEFLPHQEILTNHSFSFQFCSNKKKSGMFVYTFHGYI